MTVSYHRPPVRVAIIGLGRTAFNDHYSIYKSHPGLFDVVAACDIIKERRDIVARDYPSCRMFRQYKDIFDERDIDLVDICTCSDTHVKIALASLTHGFWTLLESPMALTDADAQILRGASVKAKNRLIVLQRGLFSPDFMLARMAMDDTRLGPIHQIVIRKEDYIRRDDWQAVKRLGGGAAYYEMPSIMLQALRLLQMPPIQMWSELKRLASLGDAEDYVHVLLKTRTSLCADIEYNGGALPGVRQPSFVIRGERGTFSVMAGAAEGVLRVIDPAFDFPRRRTSVRTPPLDDMHETFPVVEIPLALPREQPYGASAFWKHLYDTVRTAKPFPLTVEESIAALKFSHLMKKTSPFGK